MTPYVHLSDRIDPEGGRGEGAAGSEGSDELGSVSVAADVGVLLHCGGGGGDESDEGEEDGELEHRYAFVVEIELGVLLLAHCLMTPILLDLHGECINQRELDRGQRRSVGVFRREIGG